MSTCTTPIYVSRNLRPADFKPRCVMVQDSSDSSLLSYLSWRNVSDNCCVVERVLLEMYGKEDTRWCVQQRFATLHTSLGELGYGERYSMSESASKVVALYDEYWDHHRERDTIAAEIGASEIYRRVLRALAPSTYSGDLAFGELPEDLICVSVDADHIDVIWVGSTT